MAREIAKELDNRKQGDRKACPICNPRSDRVRHDQVWAWSLEHPGESPFKNDDTGRVSQHILT